MPDNRRAFLWCISLFFLFDLGQAWWDPAASYNTYDATIFLGHFPFKISYNTWKCQQLHWRRRRGQLWGSRYSSSEIFGNIPRCDDLGALFGKCLLKHHARTILATFSWFLVWNQRVLLVLWSGPLLEKMIHWHILVLPTSSARNWNHASRILSVAWDRSCRSGSTGVHKLYSLLWRWRRQDLWQPIQQSS